MCHINALKQLTVQNAKYISWHSYANMKRADSYVTPWTWFGLNPPTLRWSAHESIFEKFTLPLCLCKHNRISTKWQKQKWKSQNFRHLILPQNDFFLSNQSRILALESHCIILQIFAVIVSILIVNRTWKPVNPWRSAVLIAIVRQMHVIRIICTASTALHICHNPLPFSCHF